MDISTETDIIKLKALAFDALQAIEIQQQNLRTIQIRIQQIQEDFEKETETPKKG